MATKAQRVQQNYEALQREMRKIAGVDGGRRQWGYFNRPNITAGGQARGPQQFPGTMNVQFGMTPTDAEVKANLMRLGLGGGPAPRQAQPAATMPVGVQAAPAAPAGSSMLEKLIADSQEKEDEANQQNQLRYDQVLNNQNQLYGRTMGEVDNWGNVQKQLNDEKAAETLSAIKADMAARGIANSNVTPAFQQRNSRDLALTQQDLSERKSARRIGYDTALTQDRNAFIERRNDVGPDQNALMQLALQYGQSGNGTGTLPAQAGQQKPAPPKNPRYRPSQGAPVGGMSAMQAMMMAKQMQGDFMGNLGGAMGSMGLGQIHSMGMPSASYESNRYPTKRSKEEYAAMQDRKMSQGGGITGNSHPVGMAANAAGLAYNAWPGMQKKVGTGIADFGEGLWNAARALDGYASKIDPWAQDPNAAGAKKVMGGINALGDAAFNAGEWLYYR